MAPKAMKAATKAMKAVKQSKRVDPVVKKKTVSLFARVFALFTTKAGAPKKKTMVVTKREAKAALDAQILVVKAKENASEEATAAEKVSQKHLKDVHAGQKAAQSNFTKMQEKKDALESTFAENFPPMEAGEAKAHYKKMEPFLKKIEIEPPLLAALRSSCAKSKDERGPFDHLVLQELDKVFQEKIAALGDALAAEGLSAVAREASAQEADLDLQAKKAAREQADHEAKKAAKELFELRPKKWGGDRRSSAHFL